MSKSKDFWDKSADNYDKTEKRFEGIHGRVRAFAKGHVRDTDIVLDYGCGTGAAACELSEYVGEIHAIDISSRMIEIAKGKAAAGKKENVKFAQADIFDEDYKDATFDVILAFNMLHTVPNPEKVVRRMFDLLKPGGKFVSATPCLGGRMSFLVKLQILFVQLLLWFGVIPVPIRRLKNSDLDDLVANGNFQIVDTKDVYQGVSSYIVVARKTL